MDPKGLKIDIKELKCGGIWGTPSSILWIFWRFFNIFDRVTPMKIEDFFHFSPLQELHIRLGGLPVQRKGPQLRWRQSEPE